MLYFLWTIIDYVRWLVNPLTYTEQSKKEKVRNFEHWFEWKTKILEWNILSLESF